MCFTIGAPPKGGLRRRIAWKVLHVEPSGRLRSYFVDDCKWIPGKAKRANKGPIRADDKASHGIYVFLSRSEAVKFADDLRAVVVTVRVDPADFLFRSSCHRYATYRRVILDPSAEQARVKAYERAKRLYYTYAAYG